MGDTGDYWRDLAPHMKAVSQAKRASHRDKAPEILKGVGIDFESRNDGAHLIVKGEGTTIDFWPGTGLWKVRHTTIQRRGVFPLLRYLGKKGHHHG